MALTVSRRSVKQGEAWKWLVKNTNHGVLIEERNDVCSGGNLLPCCNDSPGMGHDISGEEMSPFRFYSLVGIKTAVDMTKRVERAGRLQCCDDSPEMGHDISGEEMSPFRFYSLVGIKTAVDMTKRVECVGRLQYAADQ